MQLPVDVDQGAGDGTDGGIDGEAQTHRMPRRRVGVLADDEHADGVERIGERPKDVGAGRKVPPAGGVLLAQEVAHRVDGVCDRLEVVRPPGIDNLGKTHALKPSGTQAIGRPAPLGDRRIPRRPPTAW